MLLTRWLCEWDPDVYTGDYDEKHTLTHTQKSKIKPWVDVRRESAKQKKNNEKLTQKKSIFKFEDFLRRLFAEYH